MTREDIYAEVMRKWPQYTIDSIADLTPAAILWLYNGDSDPKTITFATQREHLDWLARTTL